MDGLSKQKTTESHQNIRKKESSLVGDVDGRGGWLGCSISFGICSALDHLTALLDHLDLSLRRSLCGLGFGGLLRGRAVSALGLLESLLGLFFCSLEIDRLLGSIVGGGLLAGSKGSISFGRGGFFSCRSVLDCFLQALRPVLIYRGRSSGRFFGNVLDAFPIDCVCQKYVRTGGREDIIPYWVRVRCCLPPLRRP